jgi:hypothetical protein
MLKAAAAAPVFLIKVRRFIWLEVELDSFRVFMIIE